MNKKLPSKGYFLFSFVFINVFAFVALVSGFSKHGKTANWSPEQYLEFIYTEPLRFFATILVVSYLTALFFQRANGD